MLTFDEDTTAIEAYAVHRGIIDPQIKKLQAALIKLDMAQAEDSDNWDFPAQIAYVQDQLVMAVSLLTIPQK